MDECSGLIVRPLVEALEDRQMLSQFHVNLACPPTAVSGTQFEMYVWATGGAVNSGGFTIKLNDFDNTTYNVAAGSGSTGFTDVLATFPSGEHGTSTITASATSTGGTNATSVFALDTVGNYGGTDGGVEEYTPTGGTGVTGNGYAAVLDPATNDVYVAETDTTSSGTQMALTRLNSSDTPVASGFGTSGTFVISSFGGGTDVPYAAAVLDSGGTDEIALAGKCANGWAVAIVNVAGSGSLVASNGSTSLPTGQANAVTFEATNNDVIAAGVSGGKMTAVALFSTTISGVHTAGQIDANFGSSGIVTIATPTGFNSTDALAALVEPMSGGDIVLGGWLQYGTGCSASCDLFVVGLTDASVGYGTTDSSFGPNSNGEVMVNTGCVAYTANSDTGFNGCRGSGCASQDSVYSLVWDDDLDGGGASLAAVGGTNYAGHGQFSVLGLSVGPSDNGSPDTTWGPGGLVVPNITANASCAAVDDYENTTDPADGGLYLGGTASIGGSNDMLLARLKPDGSLDSSFGGGGYFTQDLGTTSGNSVDNAAGLVVEATDYTPVIVGYTGSSNNGGAVAVARYQEINTINDANSGGTAPMLAAALAAVAAQPTTLPSDTFSSGPPISGTAGEDASDIAALTARRKAGRQAVFLPPPRFPGVSL